MEVRLQLRRTHFRRCRWPYRHRWCHRIGECERCSDPERNRAWSRTPPEASRWCGGRQRRCCRWRRWTPPALRCLWPPRRRISPSAKSYPEDQGDRSLRLLPFSLARSSNWLVSTTTLLLTKQMLNSFKMEIRTYHYYLIIIIIILSLYNL